MPDAVPVDRRCVNTIKGLAMDAIQAANSGHPGAPLGMADIAHVLWSRFVVYDPSAPDWPDRAPVPCCCSGPQQERYNGRSCPGSGSSM